MRKWTILLLFAILIPALLPGCGQKAQPVSLEEGDYLEIPTDALNETIQFFSVRVDGLTMEILASRDEDGTVRTAFNTCQVCNGSRKAYFVAEGQDVVCQNCGNHFGRTDVGVLSGGCNPAPIFTEERADTANSVRISYAFLSEHSALFTRWKENNA